MFTLILILFLAYKHVVMGQNSDASKYEYLFFARSMYLCSNFMLRHQGGAEVKDVMTYFRETFDQSSNSFGLITTAQSVFLKMMGGLVKNMIEQPENLSKAIEALLMATQGIPDGSLFNREGAGMQLDLLLKQIRSILLGVIQSEAAMDLKIKCV